MKNNATGKRAVSSAAIILACLVLGLLVNTGCFNPRADIRIPDIPKIPAIPAPQSSQASEGLLGYGTVVTTDGQSIVGWWRVDRATQTYQRHEAPSSRSGRPTGYERTIEAIPDSRVVGFKLK
ncbi:MAG: hypothetical protein HN350_10820 [Phycisphaerales bacterium]|jgi:hypothetical protein|nr:hypothetical protein [Phycisphaerales bacterium]